MKGYRTIITNLVALAPIVADVVVSFASEGLGELIPAAYLPYYTLVVILANVYLRTITTTRVGQRE